MTQQEELEQWAIAAKQKEEDNLVLEKYTRSDELKIKDLNLQLEKITQAMVDRKSEVESEVSKLGVVYYSRPLVLTPLYLFMTGNNYTSKANGA